MTSGESLHFSGPQIASRVVVRLKGLGHSYTQGSGSSSQAVLPPSLQPLAVGGEKARITAETGPSISKLPGSVSRSSSFSNPQPLRRDQPQPPSGHSPSSQDPKTRPLRGNVTHGHRMGIGLPGAAVRGNRTASRSPVQEVGQGGPQCPSPLAPPAPEKTLHYWKPSQAEGVEVAVREETSQGQPNLGP